MVTLVFKQVNAEECVALDVRRLLSLPPPWHKYEKFVKICPVRRNARSKPVVSMVSIWTEDYLKTKEVKTWENFPHSIVVNEQFQEVATLPAMIESPIEPVVYFGKWKGALPTEVRVDVHDPTVSGDYYYPPFKWDDKDRRYYMSDEEPKPGRRPPR